MILKRNNAAIRKGNVELWHHSSRTGTVRYHNLEFIWWNQHRSETHHGSATLTVACLPARPCLERVSSRLLLISVLLDLFFLGFCEPGLDQVGGAFEHHSNGVISHMSFLDPDLVLIRLAVCKTSDSLGRRWWRDLRDRRRGIRANGAHCIGLLDKGELCRIVLLAS
jgi:hypothetical protein